MVALVFTLLCLAALGYLAVQIARMHRDSLADALWAVRFHARRRAVARAPRPIVHERRRQIHEHLTFGERAADAVAGGMGSWRFIILQSAIIVFWIGANAWLLTHPFDPAPFILLNLAFSTQAAYAAPILQLAGNRQAAKDRKRDDIEAREVDMLVKLLKQNTALTEQNNRLTEQMATLTREVHAHITGERTAEADVQPAPSPARPPRKRAAKPAKPVAS